MAGYRRVGIASILFVALSLLVAACSGGGGESVQDGGAVAPADSGGADVVDDRDVLPDVVDDRDVLPDVADDRDVLPDVADDRDVLPDVAGSDGIAPVDILDAVGPSGGRIEGPGGVVFEIPAGALDGPVVFEISAVEGASPEPWMSFVGGVWDIGPSGTVFDPPATLHLPFDASGLPDGADPAGVFVYTAPTSAGPWTSLPTTRSDGALVAEVRHLSRFAGGSGCRPAGHGCDDETQCCGEDVACFGGVCGGCRAAGQACETGFDCCGGLSCDDGVCQSCRPFGAACSSITQCCNGWSVACLEGVCANCLPEGAACSSRADCCGDQACVEGHCSQDCAPLGQECVWDADCCGRFSHGDICRGVCKGCLQIGDVCGDDIHACCGSAFCEDGVCRGCRENGTSCYVDGLCCSGMCVEGQCAACSPDNHVCDVNAECCSGTCERNTCVPCPDAGFGCANTGACCPGSCCEDGPALTCFEEVCSTCTPSGESCSLDSACCGALLCIDRECTPCREAMMFCRLDSECCGALQCEENRCVECQPRDAACGDLAPCCEERCVSGVCTDCVEPAGACDDDEDCCSYDCEDGHCVACVSEGETCDDFSRCCAPHHECEGSVCVRTCSVAPESCTERPCCDGFLCLGEACVSCWEEGDWCDGEHPCCPGSFCGDEGLCESCPEEGASCRLEDCCEHQRCVDDVCTACQPGGEACGPDDVCCLFHECHEGRCEECAQGGESCVDAPCCEDSYCVEGVCVDCGRDGQACTDDVPCCDGAFCVDGACVGCGSTGDSCGGADDVACCDGYECGDGLCFRCSPEGTFCDESQPCCAGSACSQEGRCELVQWAARSCGDDPWGLGLPRGSFDGRLSAEDGNHESHGGCPDGFASVVGVENRAEGPDEWLEQLWPGGSTLVVATHGRGVATSVQVRGACDAGDPGECLGSTWGGYTIGWPSGGKQTGVHKPGPGESWWSGAALPAQVGKAEGDRTVRLVVDSWQDPGESAEGDYTLYWRVLEGAPDNDLPVGAAALEAGVPLVPESGALAGDDWSASGCPGVEDGAGAGSVDLFYQLSASEEGLYAVGIALLNEVSRAGSAVYVLAADGTCLGSAESPWQRELKTIVALEAGDTATMVVELGEMPAETVFLGLAYRYDGPTNTTCGRPEAISGLPTTIAADLSRGFDDVRIADEYMGLIAYTGDSADRVWTYTPAADEWVRFRLSAVSQGFRPSVILTTECAAERAVVTPFDAFAVGTEGEPVELVRQLTGGTTYYIVAEGGGDGPGQFELVIEPGEPNAPDGCDRPRVIESVPAELTLRGRDLTDRFQGSGETPAEGYRCSPSEATVGDGLPDAVLAYTATEAGLLSVTLDNRTPDHVYILKDVCVEGLVASCGGPTQDDEHASAQLSVGETAYIVLDGYRAWNHEARVRLDWSALATNETCSSAAPLALPFEESASLAFAADDIHVADSEGCVAIGSDGAELVWRYDPAGVARDIVVGVLDDELTWSLYALLDCDTAPNGSCVAGLNETYGVPDQLVLRQVQEPLYIAVDHPAEVAPGAFSLVAQAVETPVNDTCGSAVVIDTLPFRVTANNVDAANDYPVPAGTCASPFDVPFDTAMGPDVVYRLDVTQELKDAYFRIAAQARRATFDIDIVVMRNGCDPATHCERTNLDGHDYIPLTLYSVGDSIYFVISGADEGDAGAGIFTFEIVGHE